MMLFAEPLMLRIEFVGMTPDVGSLPPVGVERLKTELGVEVPIPTLPVNRAFARGASNVFAHVRRLSKLLITCVASAVVPLLSV
jgi:hypothetical protein